MSLIIATNQDKFYVDESIIKKVTVLVYHLLSYRRLLFLAL